MGRPSSSLLLGFEVELGQPRSSSSAIIRPEEEACLRFRFLPEEALDGSEAGVDAVRYFWAR